MHSIATEAFLDLIGYGEELMLFSSSRDTEREEIERMRYLAVERLFELLGECMNRALDAEPSLSEHFPDAHRAISMRNRIAHEYDGIDVEIIWETATFEVPALIDRVRTVLDQAVAN